MFEKHILTIKPAIPPEDRHKLEDALKQLDYDVWGGGQMVDGSECDISFDKEVNLTLIRKRGSVWI